MCIAPLYPPGWRYLFIKRPEYLRGFSIRGPISTFWRGFIHTGHLYTFLPHMKGDLLPAAQPLLFFSLVGLYPAFWAPYRPTDPVPKLRYQVVHQLRACHTRLLIIDEFHSLLTGGAVKQRETMNAIKLLCNELMIPIAGVGTQDAVRVLHSDP